MDLFLQQLANGLVIGSTYAVVAIGFALAFTVLRVINFAHPDIFMVGWWRRFSGPRSDSS
jgi:branched-chain amino acid transport system permease protein